MPLTTSVAQDNCNYSIDELIQETVKIKELTNRDIDSAFAMSINLKECFATSQDQEKIAIALLCAGEVLVRKGVYEDAIENYNSVLLISQKKNLVDFEIKALYSLGHVYSLKENLPLSLKYYLASSDLAMSQENVQLKVETDLQLAEYYRRSKKYEKSLKYLNRVRMHLSEHQLNISYKIRMLNRYAAVWTETNQNLDSIVIFSKQSLELAKSIGDLHSQALAYNEMAARSEYFTVEERINFYKKAKEIWADLGYVRYEALPTMHLVNAMCVPQNKYQEAIELISPLIDRLPDNIWEKDVLYQQLSGSYEALGDYQRALDVNRKRFLTFSNIKDETTDKQIEELTLNYEARKTEEELASKSDDLVVEKAEKNFFVLLVIALLIISFIVMVFLIINYRKNVLLKLQQKEIVKQSEELKTLLTEKEVLLKEVNHRVKNNMIMVSSILEMQQETTQDEVVKKSLQTGVDRVRSLTYAHQQLYQTENYTVIELNAYLKILVENLLIDSDVQLELHFDRIYHFPIEKAQAIGFVINELITNSLKHGWEAVDLDLNKKITIDFLENDTYLIVNYKDNGTGLDEEMMKASSNSLGLMLINSFVSRQLEGSISYKSSEGAQIQFTCKKD